MNEIITINATNINEDTVNTVNARDLHEYLGVGKDFSTWIKERIKKYGFEEGIDYIILQNSEASNTKLPKNGEAQPRASQRIEYHITLDMAKELCMVENNEKGRIARKHFIKVEKQYKQNQLLLEDRIFNKFNMLLEDKLSRQQLEDKAQQAIEKAKQAEQKAKQLENKNEAIRKKIEKIKLKSTAVAYNYIQIYDTIVEAYAKDHSTIKTYKFYDHVDRRLVDKAHDMLKD